VLLDAFVLERVFFSRPGPKLVFCALHGELDPLLDLANRDPMLAGGLLNRRLALDDAHRQRSAALGGPPLNVVVRY